MPAKKKRASFFSCVLVWPSESADLEPVRSRPGLEVENESLSEYAMRGVWPYRVLGRDPLPLVPLGFEKRSARERDGGCAESGTARAFGALN
jgi:hypothetical protein